MSKLMHSRAKAAWDELQIDAYSSPSPTRQSVSRAASARRSAARATPSSGRGRSKVTADNDPDFVDARLVAAAVQQRLSTPGPNGSRRSDRLPRRSQSSSKSRSAPPKKQTPKETPSDKFRTEFEEAMARVKAMQSTMSMPLMPEMGGASAEIAARQDSASPPYSTSGTQQLLHEKLSIPKALTRHDGHSNSRAARASTPSESIVNPDRGNISAAGSASGTIAAQARAAARRRSQSAKPTPTKALHFRSATVSPSQVSASKAGFEDIAGVQAVDMMGASLGEKYSDSSTQRMRGTHSSASSLAGSRASSRTSSAAAPAAPHEPNAGGMASLAGNVPGTASELRHLRGESAAALARAARAERLLKEAVSELSAWRRDRAALAEAKRQAEERAAVLQSNVDELRSKVRAARARRAADAQALSDIKAEVRALKGQIRDQETQLADADTVMETAHQENSILRAQLQASEEQRAELEGQVETGRVQLARLRGALDALHKRTASQPPSPQAQQQPKKQAEGAAGDQGGDASLVAHLVQRLVALEQRASGSHTHTPASARQRGDSAGSTSQEDEDKATVPRDQAKGGETVRLDDLLA